MIHAHAAVAKNIKNVVEDKSELATPGTTNWLSWQRVDSGFPFHVPVSENSRLTGFIMVEQVKSVDFRTRRAKRIERASDELLANVLSILDACIY